MKISRLIFLVPALLLLQLPDALLRFGIHGGVILFVLPAGIWLMARRLALRAPRQKAGWLLWMLMGYLAIYIIASLRTALSGSTVAGGAGPPLIYMPIFMAILFSAVARSWYVDFSRIAKYIAWACVLYIYTNLLLYIGGVKTPATEAVFNASDTASLLSKIIPGATRVDFLLSSGIQKYGTFCGATFVMAAGGLLRGKQGRLVYLLLLFGSLMSVIATDSRGPILFSVVAISLVWWSRRAAATAIYAVFCLGLVWPLVLGLLAAGGLDLSGVGLDSRSNSSFVDNRDVIWLSAFTFLGNLKVADIFGYGLYGHVISGVSGEYASMFGLKGGEVNTFSLHNFALQSVFDIGYLGYVYFVVLIAKFMRVAKFSFIEHDHGSFYFYSIFLYFAMVGMTEVAPSIYLLDSFTIFLSAFYVVLIARKSQIRRVQQLRTAVA